MQKKLFILLVIVCIQNIALAENKFITIDTTKPVRIHSSEPKTDAEKNVLVVLDGKIAGKMGDIKNIETIVPVEKIKSVNVLKDSSAIAKYGDKGKWGVVEIVTKIEMKLVEVREKDLANGEEKVFDKVEVEAAFPGGDANWRKYLVRTVNPAVGSDNGAPMGMYTTVVQFIVDKEGNISDVRALTNHGYGMEEEVVKVIKKGPKWTPAVQQGRMVKAYRKQPVTFQVEDPDITIDASEGYTFRTGVTNALYIKVNKVKDEDLNVSISQGTIIRIGKGNFEVKGVNPGKAIITLTNEKTKKEIGRVNFFVR